MEQIKKNALHYRIACLGGIEGVIRSKNAWLDYGDPKRDQVDICQYTRRFLYGAFVGLLLCFLAMVELASFGYWIVAGWIYLTQHKLVDFGAIMMPAMITVILAIVVAVIALWIKAQEFVTEVRRKHFPRKEETKEPSFLSTMYRAWKDKYCFYIKVDREDY